MGPARTTENKALIRRWFEEVWNQGREEVIEELRAPDSVGIGLGETPVAVHGAIGFKVFYQNLRSSLPDLRVTVEHLIAEGDMVAAHIQVEGTHMGEGLGVPPTGEIVRFSGMLFARIADGKIAESWNNLDQLGLLRQVGAVPLGAGPDHFLSKRG
ncbi:MAG TPA: ester cyclase [Bryobacteraceae bacterium]|nr:ester cyclase [Bryobacteraceae bacterium]